MSKIFYISLSLIIIALLYDNDNTNDNANDTNDYSLKPIIKKSNDELGKIKKFIKLKEHRIKEFDNLIYNYLEKNNKYTEIINIIEKSNIEIEKINKEIERLKSEMNKN
jgi:hypothetical protein